MARALGWGSESGVRRRDARVFCLPAKRQFEIYGRANRRLNEYLGIRRKGNRDTRQLVDAHLRGDRNGCQLRDLV